MDRSVIAEIASHFNALSSIVPLHTIGSEHDYDKAVATLNQLLDAGAADEKHPLADLVNILGALIYEYDQVHYPAQEARPLAIKNSDVESLARLNFEFNLLRQEFRAEIDRFRQEMLASFTKTSSSVRRCVVIVALLQIAWAVGLILFLKH